MRVRIQFNLPHSVKHGADVMDQLGKSVGQVVGVRQNEKEDKPYLNRDGAPVEGPWFIITADVEEEAKGGKLQCLQQIGPL